MFSKIKNFDAIYQHHSSCKINAVFFAHARSNSVDRGSYLRVALNLRMQDLKRGLRVSLGAVRIIQTLVAVKFISSCQRSLLHHMKDLLHIYQASSVGVKVEAGPEELF